MKAKKKETVDSIYRKLCKKDEVFIDGHCEKIILMPKERKIIHQELPMCHFDQKPGNPIVERAKQRLLRDIYKDKTAKMNYREYAGVTREEIEVSNEG